MTDLVAPGPSAPDASTPPDDPASAAPSRRWRPTTWSPTRLALACSVLYLPFVGTGYGTDVDITNLLRSGDSIFEGEYRYSRPPGALPYEFLVGALSRVGGPLAVNLASAAMATALLVALGRLVAGAWTPRAGRIAVIVLATQPWFWVAATSLGDYVFALGFLLAGVAAARRDQRLLAGAGFAVAIGFRSGTVLLVGAWLLAEITGDGGRARVRAAVTTGLTTGALAMLWFIPSWLSVGRTNRFLLNEFETTGVPVMIGRWGIKNAAFFGVWTILVLAVSTPVLLAALRLARTQVLVRFAVLAAVFAELLFLRFPWKPVHLLPTALCVAILLAASPRTRPVTVVAVVASQLLLAVVGVTVAQPDVADAATTGRLQLGFTAGVVVNDLDCRLDPRHEGVWPDLDTPQADFAAIDVFTCQARSWRAAPPAPAG